jgi:hypothetical protein
LQRCVLDELALEGVQFALVGHALDGGDLLVLRLDAQHQAGADQHAVDDDRAGAAVAGAAAFLGAGQPEAIAQAVEQGLARVGEELGRLAVDVGGDVDLAHFAAPFARS